MQVKSVVTFCNPVSLNLVKFTFYIFFNNKMYPQSMWIPQKRVESSSWIFFFWPTFQKMCAKNVLEEMMSQTYWYLTESSLKVSDNNPRQLFCAASLKLDCSRQPLLCLPVLRSCWYTAIFDKIIFLNICCNWPSVHFRVLVVLIKPQECDL